MNDPQTSIQTTQYPGRAVHACLARLTQGLSPVSMVSAFTDWLTHFAISPGGQQELAKKAVRQSTRLSLHAFKSMGDHCEPCIEPLPHGHRFAAPEWKQWPYNLIYQSFLLNQQWWHNAMTGVQGVTGHHEQLVTFAVRQMLDMFSPSNFLLTNPEVLSATVKSGGASLLQGAQNRFEDAMLLAIGQPVPGTEKFRPGYEVAVTPAEVTFCLTSGTHNVGIVNPPGTGVNRSYQLATRGADDHYIDPVHGRPRYLRMRAGPHGRLGCSSTLASVAPVVLGNKAHPALENAPSRHELIP